MININYKIKAFYEYTFNIKLPLLIFLIDAAFYKTSCIKNNYYFIYLY